MEQVSALMRDQMERPLDRAVYWIEYVIRHHGAPHLRTASRNLSLFQRGMLDVALVIFLFSLLMAYAAGRLCRSVLHPIVCRQLDVKDSSKPLRSLRISKPKSKLN